MSTASKGKPKNEGDVSTTNDDNKETQAKEDNPFDPSSLRLSQDFAATIGVRKVHTTIPVRKPNRQDFVRVHPSDEYRLETMVLELKDENETYLVTPSLWPELSDELIPKVLFTTINRQGVLSLWPVRMPGEDGKLDEWNASALIAAEMAQSSWVRMVSNRSLGAYEAYEATGNLPEPDWPELRLSEILQIAFKGQYITDIEHPVIRRLRGEQ